MTVLELIATATTGGSGGGWRAGYILGPALGSAITVLGVALTSWFANKQQTRAIEAATDQQEAGYRNEVRKQHMIEVLGERREIYVELLTAANGLDGLLGRRSRAIEDGTANDVDYDEVTDLELDLSVLENKARVYCEVAVRTEAGNARELVGKWASRWNFSGGFPAETPAPPPELGDVTRRVRGAIEEATIKDRTSPAEPDGLGGR